MFGFTFSHHTHRLTPHTRTFSFTSRGRWSLLVLCCALCCSSFASRLHVTAQTPTVAAGAAVERRIDGGGATEISIRNPRGRVRVTTAEATGDVAEARVVLVTATPGLPTVVIAESEVTAERSGSRVTITTTDLPVGAATQDDDRIDERRRIDLDVRVPMRSRVRVETTGGAVDVVGDVRSLDARTATGTIRVDVPSDNLRYDFEWTAARPRVYSLLDLAATRENRGGRFTISGRIPDTKKKKDASAPAGDGATDDESRDDTTNDAADDAATDAATPEDREREEKRAKEDAKKRLRAQLVELRLVTERGIVLVGADPATVPADLRPRTLTEAARVLIRTGDETLIERVRRLAPSLVDEYAGTLRGRRDRTPTINRRASTTNDAGAESNRVSRINAAVTDRAGRPVLNLTKDDFVVRVGGRRQEVVSVAAADAPFNLILLLDVSGSVEERLDFIRRAALRFVSTASARDRISIVTFRDDVSLISDFTADRAELAARINTIQAGGATALYDALGYTLLETLRTLPESERERAAIVVLSDGDDNRSFLSFANVLDLTDETGTPLYPLYVPSALIPAGTAAATTQTRTNTAAPTSADPTRDRALTLTTVATSEGATLARTTGGVFYPVTRLEDLQRAYDDIVRQLRTSYTLTFRPAPGETTPPRGEPGLRVEVLRPGTVVARTSELKDER